MAERKKAPSAKQQAEPVEKQLYHLEEITKKMEEGSLPLEDMMKLYKEGKALEKQIRAALDQTDKELEVLSAGTPDKPEEA